MNEPYSSTHPAGAGADVAAKGGLLGLWQIVFLVISAAAPLTGMLGAVPPAISLGNGAGIPGAFVIAGVVLLVFSVGFASMSRHVVRAGAFYAYISAGLGRPAGMGGAFVALVSYTAIQIALYGLFGFFGTVVLGPLLHTGMPWYVYSLACVAVVQVTGIRGIDLNSRLLGVLMSLELGILLVLAVAIVIHGGGPDGLTLAPLAPRNVFSGHVGIAVMFAFASFIGFEATAIYGKECRDPKVTVPRATYVSVTLILVFFAFVTWAIVCAYGMKNVADVATKQPGDFWFIQSGQYLGGALTTAMSFLLLTSIFASLLSFHNTIVRYIHALSGEGILPAALDRLHPKYGSPYLASYLQTLSVCVPLGLFIAAGSDPFNVVFSWDSALGTIGIVMLQAVTSFSVVAFFRATKKDTRLWHSLVAPVLGGIGLLWIGVLLVRNLDALSGSDSPVVRAFPWIVLAVALAGVAIGFVLRRTRPDIYARFGQ
ncbi:APC family permease [Paraburkholderia caballeronis]|uniref:Amino acid transporter n=1 Tax=Paraburkholderia caballeronis TaxID=416943 RepID=A0A1H7U2E0_9BURK|nr:APC family permease [Paraburkholderia caballeronis]PXW23438.1 amino acid/polyamine/organocation transporter (APC superfamily) [Paraburkholderia caballeronis]PXW98431.1 amino acid/polyamine/organocation transporter (APC superfamily) [Paraburkholderia caballeronis]RAJ95162.1 amino acid/polyamine/organocation transporter (APC superfamily) [Paraburkholderia caballeronis]SEC53369.1 amino acid/polyamine/organocation transporter, APC superfamily [Paraburkholderia caballeronis]SEL90417.1 Amino acid